MAVRAPASARSRRCASASRRRSLRRPLDQAVKLWLLYGFDLPGRGRVPLTPFLDLVLAWNTGISYGLFQQAGPLGQWALFALKVIAVVLLGLWLARTGSRLSGLALGLIIGGRDRQCDRPRWCTAP